MNEKRWPHGYRTGFCCDGNHHLCGKDVCQCSCHRAQCNGQAPKEPKR